MIVKPQDIPNIGRWLAYFFGGFDSVEQAAASENKTPQEYINTFIDDGKITLRLLWKAEQFLDKYDVTKLPEAWFHDHGAPTKDFPTEHLFVLAVIIRNWN